MPPTAEAARLPRLGPRLLVTEAILGLVALVLCGVPLAFYAARIGVAGTGLRVLGPLALAGWAAAVLRLIDLMRPVSALLRAKQRQEPVLPAATEAAQRALARAPIESALLHAALWAGLLAAVGIWSLRNGGSVLLFAAMAVTVAVHAAGALALRALVLGRALGCLRPLILANVEGMRVFAVSYRAQLIGLGIAGLGLAHALLAVAAMAYVRLTPEQRATSALLLWPVLVPSAFLWMRSLRRRTSAIHGYFDVVARAGTRGPAREEPQAVAAFVAAQALPYRLAGYAGFSLLLSGVLGVAAARSVAGLGVPTAARLLGALGVATVALALHLVVAFRRVVRPLIAHLGSRHHLPVAQIRSRVGLRPKLLVCFLGVMALPSGALALHLAARRPPGVWGAVALVACFAVTIAFTWLVTREVVMPLQSLEARSEEMARGELARPVPASAEADELGRVMVAFEEMRRSLRDRLRSTESINIDLEREVRRRTEALEQRNADLRQALEKLRRAQDELVRSEKLASMGRLVAGIAHEINNPVNAVINSLDPLEEIIREIAAAGPKTDTAELARTAEEMLAVIQRGAARTKAIVQALHNYSRGDETVQREVNLARSLDDSLDLLRHRLRQVKIIKQVDPAARILGFPGQIDQVLMNLVTNAAQAIGEREGVIQVRAEVQNAEVVVTVADDGPGIPSDVLPRIFDPFFTTKDVGEGSGLGLSIVHGIVERHGGRIAVDSQPGRGTTFKLHFPLHGGITPAPTVAQA
jgi:signal transduction histidine kinase